MRIKRVVNGDPLALTPEYAFAQPLADEWEKAMYERFKSTLTLGATVIDIGASFGLYTIAAARGTGRSGRVFAFEPARRSAAALRLHLTWNGVADRAEVIEAAVTAYTGSAMFWEQDVSFVAGLAEASARAEERRFAVPVERRSVACVALDDFCAARAIVPDVIKIDVEGAEAAVLRGARDILARRRAVLFLEVHQRLSGAEPLAMLDAAGWACEQVGQEEATRHYVCAPGPAG